MPQDRYRKVPMHQQVQPGSRVKRVAVPGMPTNQQNREGTVIGPAVEKGRSAWYLPIMWDGSRRPEEVHVSRLMWLNPTPEEQVAG